MQLTLAHAQHSAILRVKSRWVVLGYRHELLLLFADRGHLLRRSYLDDLSCLIYFREYMIVHRVNSCVEMIPVRGGVRVLIAVL